MGNLIKVVVIFVHPFENGGPGGISHRRPDVHRHICFGAPMMPPVIDESRYTVFDHLFDGLTNGLIQRADPCNDLARRDVQYILGRADSGYDIRNGRLIYGLGAFQHDRVNEVQLVRGLFIKGPERLHLPRGDVRREKSFTQEQPLFRGLF